MKILHVSPYYMPARAYGGRAESLYRLCLNLARLGCDVRVLTTNANGPGKALDVETGSQVAVAAGFEVTYSSRTVRNSVSPGLLMRLPFEARRAEVVHLTGVYWFPTIPTLLTCKLLGKPLVWSPRGDLLRWRGSRGRISKRIWDLACRIAAPRTTVLHLASEAEREASLRRFPKFPATVIPNAVRAPANVRHSSPNGILRLGYLGRLHAKKGIENLLAACVLLKERGVAFSLVIAGAGSKRYTRKLATRIAALGVSEFVRMTGEVRGPSKHSFFEAIDILVVPSHGESFATAVTEALARAVPVIASHETPWSRLNEKGCGLWVDNSPESLADAIDRMREMPIEEMGLRGREWMTVEFSWDKVAREVCNAYSEILRGAPVIGDNANANASIASAGGA